MNGIQKTLVVSFLFALHVTAQIINVKYNVKFDLPEYRMFVVGVIVYFLVDHGVNSKYNSNEGSYPQGYRGNESNNNSNNKEINGGK